MNRLFDEYNNKNIFFLLNYLNSISIAGIDCLTDTQIEELLLGGKSQLTSTYIVDGILNKNELAKSNLYLLCKDEYGAMHPIFPNDDCIPFLVSDAEMSWLNYALDDRKADLFLDKSLVSRLKSICDKAENYPLKKDYIEIKSLNQNQSPYSDTYIKTFKKLADQITKTEVTYIREINGTEHKNIIPYRLIYDAVNDCFSLLAIAVEGQKSTPGEDLLFIDISSIKDVKSVPDSLSKETIQEICATTLQGHLVSEKIDVLIKTGLSQYPAKITGGSDADDRFNYLFSNYNRYCHFNEDNDMVVSIEYYDFQYNDVLQKILSLGKYIKVLSPKSVQADIINIIQRKCSLYE